MTNSTLSEYRKNLIKEDKEKELTMECVKIVGTNSNRLMKKTNKQQKA